MLVVAQWKRTVACFRTLYSSTVACFRTVACLRTVVSPIEANKGWMPGIAPLEARVLQQDLILNSARK